jgi:hypothetical protein
MSERDPRVDPRPGDVLRGGGLRREVIDLGDVYGAPYQEWLAKWREWAANAEVVKRGDE